jgi:hypothetical protein
MRSARSRRSCRAASRFRLQPVSKMSPRIGPGRGLVGRRNRSEPLFGSAQPNCRGWVGVLSGVRVLKIITLKAANCGVYSELQAVA